MKVTRYMETWIGQQLHTNYLIIEWRGNTRGSRVTSINKNDENSRDRRYFPTLLDRPQGI